MIDHTRLRKLLDYDPATGFLTWKSLPSPYANIKVGSRAGTYVPDAYAFVKVDGRQYAMHRLIWFYVTGAWPRNVDHKDLNKHNNSWSNLREATTAENGWNAPAYKTNKLGVKGVCKRSNRPGYIAQITRNGVKYNLGYFKTLEEARRVYEAANKKLHGEFSRTV